MELLHGPRAQPIDIVRACWATLSTEEEIYVRQKCTVVADVMDKYINTHGRENAVTQAYLSGTLSAMIVQHVNDILWLLIKHFFDVFKFEMSNYVHMFSLHSECQYIIRSSAQRLPLFLCLYKVS